jgi:oxygen-independent coproporphyrinogen III oxidase
MGSALPRLTGVYIHLPFCDVKCAYCDFFSIASRHPTDEFWSRYTKRLLNDLQVQLRLLSQDTPRPVLASVFFGGGTPSKAPAFLMQQVIEATRAAFKESLPAVEITAEGNPESLTEQVLADWQHAGINRVSVGMQSLDPGVLKYLGRLYSPQAYAEVLHRVKAAGIPNFNADFITGVPGQSVDSTLADLDFAINSGAAHISLYQLTIEPGTLLKQRIASGRREALNDSQQVAQMEAAIQHLKQAGLERYEISNFAMQGKRCLHNRIYWTHRPYLGLGVAAHAFTGKRRFYHPRSLDMYMESALPAEDLEAVPRDALINRLRLAQPLHVGAIGRLFPSGTNAKIEEILSHAKENGWIDRRGNLFRLTQSGTMQMDSLLAQLWNLKN